MALRIQTRRIEPDIVVVEFSGGLGTVHKEFETTRLNKVFRVYPTVEDACRGFGG